MKQLKKNKENGLNKGISDDHISIIKEYTTDIDKDILDKNGIGELDIDSLYNAYTSNSYTSNSYSSGITTSCSSITTTTTGTGTKISYAPPYTVTNNFIYHILGEDIELSVYPSTDFVSFIAILNVLGESYYREFKKNNGPVVCDLEDFIEKRLKMLKRDKIIDKLVKED
ncbi:MAG: hypothetical protein M0R46_13170 [Candidatus Muirbacterium halophilum]|nr:hypothetical protein [Candidatus Muirbacterium halophilum]